MNNFRKTTIVFSFIFFGLVTCMMLGGRCNPNETGHDSRQIEETQEDTIIDAPLADNEIDLVVNPPYYYDSTASYIPCMYGMIEQHERVDYLDKSYFPPIPDLYFKSCMESCPRDNCKSKRAVLAIRCPKNEQLLHWASDKACYFANKCIDDSSCYIRPNFSLKSDKEICDYYIGNVRRSLKNKVKDCLHEADSPLEQRGMMIADVWQKGRFHTFIVSDWYDWLSCGDNTAFAYVTVDSSTGDEVTYTSLMNKSDEKKLGNLLLKYLRNGRGSWVSGAIQIADSTGTWLLSQMDGCALLEEGLLIYYYPYTVGSGADGEFIAIIPYEVLMANKINFQDPYNQYFGK